MNKFPEVIEVRQEHIDRAIAASRKYENADGKLGMFPICSMCVIAQACMDAGMEDIVVSSYSLTARLNMDSPKVMFDMDPEGCAIALCLESMWPTLKPTTVKLAKVGEVHP